ncbi:MAG: hypothetical protein ACYC9M_06110 [Desulfobulbaceae bacterium]
MVKLAAFKLIPPLDTYPKVVDFAQTVPGKILLLAVFSAGISFRIDGWPHLMAFIAVMTFLPQFRPALLTIATFGTLSLTNWPIAETPWPISQLQPAVPFFFRPLIVAAVLASFAAYYLAVKKNKEKWYAKQPIRNVLVMYILLLMAATHAPLSALPSVYLWTFLAVLGKYLWFFNYTLLDRHARETPHLALQAGFYTPFWGGSATPFPKGAAYLRKIEARTPEQLARSQLKGVKLLYWALLLSLLEKLLRHIFYGTAAATPSFFGIPLSLGIPSFHAVLHAGDGQPYPWHINWLALIANFFMRLVWFSVWGHTIIACCRMAGYNALRNTYRPLQSASIAEFWNRFYYYFKELLVDNFFYPAFLRYFKKWPRLRLFFATMAAACFGNILYHFLRDIGPIAEKGLWQALLSLRVYMFYALVLGIAISLSQLYEKKKKNDMSWIRKNIITPVYVVGFYCILSIFDSADTSLTLTDLFIFVLKLFNIHLTQGFAWTTE